MVLRMVSQFWLNQGQTRSQAMTLAVAPCSKGRHWPRRASRRPPIRSSSRGSQSSTKPVGRVRATSPSPIPLRTVQSQRRPAANQRRWLRIHQLPVMTAVRLRSIR